MRKEFYKLRVVKHWNRLFREVVDASSLKTFKVRLDRAPNKVMELKMSLLVAEDFYPTYSVIL